MKTESSSFAVGAGTSASRPAAKRVWFDDENMWLELKDGRQLSVPLAYFPRLLHATLRERKRFETSGGGTGLHWEHLDEDISVRGLLLGVGDQTRSAPREPSRSGATAQRRIARSKVHLRAARRA